MNQLPFDRQVIHGRTFSRSWRAADMDPIQRPDISLADRIGGVVLACSIGALLAVVLVAWWSS